jgi:hypothetical protein
MTDIELTDAKLAELRSLEAKAMSDEWEVDAGRCGGAPYYAITRRGVRVVADVHSKDDAAFIVAARSALRPLVDEVVRLRSAVAKAVGDAPYCNHCGRSPATCIGRYEDQERDQLACDECCGHGCEDGSCTRLDNPAALIERGRRGGVLEANEKHEATLAKRDAEIARLREALSSQYRCFSGNGSQVFCIGCSRSGGAEHFDRWDEIVHVGACALAPAAAKGGA